MLIRACMNCKYHQIRDDEEEKRSFCQKEYCWSRFSKCVEKKALERFFEQEFVSPQFVNIMF